MKRLSLRNFLCIDVFRTTRHDQRIPISETTQRIFECMYYVNSIVALSEISNNVLGTSRRSVRKLEPRYAELHLCTRTSLMIV